MLNEYRCWLRVIFCGGLLLPAALLADSISQVKKNGVSVAFDVTPLASDVPTERLRADEHVSIQFRIQDANHQPLSGLYPAAWIHPGSPEEDGAEDICINKAKAFIGGSLLSRAELDLNVYYVLTLNQDATISVVDPLFGFGGSKLLTMLSLNGVGYDWAVSSGQQQVYVSLPSADAIAAINTANWQITHHASDGQWQAPTTLKLPPNQAYLWALVDGGVALFNRQPFALRTVIPTPSKPVALTFSADGRFAYTMTHNQLSVIDTDSLSVATTITLGELPVSMDYSVLAEQLYISHAGSGEIWVIDGQQHTISQIIAAEPGIGMLRFAPGGRWGMLVNPMTDRLSIIDSAKQAIVQSGRVEGRPEYIAFSDNLGYIRHADSSNLYMITLDDQNLGRPGADIPTVDTPGGDSPPGLIAIPSGSDGIVQAPGSNAVLVSNYHDKAVYFYKEGMAAPMGQFNNYGKFPRAVLAIDHSLRERELPGVYSTTTVLPEPGHYQAIYFMDSPRLVHCFAFDIEPSLEQAGQPPVDQLLITPIVTEPDLKAGRAVKLAFQVTSQAADAAPSAEQYEGTIILASGLWRQRLSTEASTDNTVSLEFTPPLPGTYYVYLKPANSQTPQHQHKFSYVVSP